MSNLLDVAFSTIDSRKNSQRPISSLTILRVNAITYGYTLFIKP